MRATYRLLYAAVRVGIVLLILAYILQVLRSHVSDIRDIPVMEHPWLMLLSLAVLCLHFLLLGLMWHLLTTMNGAATPLGVAVASWCASTIGRYVPGKVFLLAARVYYGSQRGVSVKRITFCFTLETTLYLFTAALFVAIAGSLSDIPIVRPYRTAVWMFIVAATPLLHPRLLEFVLNKGLQVFRRAPVHIDMRRRDLAVLVIGYGIAILVFGVAALLFARCFYAVEYNDYWYLTSAFMFSGIIGMLAPFAPGGLGVREGVLLVALQGLVPPGQAALLALASRVWGTAAEFLCAGLGFAYLKLVAPPPATPLPIDWLRGNSTR